jgi:hypothetical protein
MTHRKIIDKSEWRKLEGRRKSPLIPLPSWDGLGTEYVPDLRQKLANKPVFWCGDSERWPKDC